MTDDELKSLVCRFEDRTLPREKWTHAAHLSVAVWYLCLLSRAEATERIRAGIQRYNAILGNSSGYHETITLAWIELLSSFLTSRSGTPAELANEATARFGASDGLLRHFSKERLFSDLARRAWVEPDLERLA